MNAPDFISQLLDKGYKRFDDHFNNAKDLYQKRYTDTKGVRYFINVYHYDWSNYPQMDKNDSFQFDMQARLDKEGKDQTVNISYSADFIKSPYRPLTTLEEAEQFFEDMFNRMRFDYYELY